MFRTNMGILFGTGCYEGPVAGDAGQPDAVVAAPIPLARGLHIAQREPLRWGHRTPLGMQHARDAHALQQETRQRQAAERAKPQ